MFWDVEKNFISWQERNKKAYLDEAEDRYSLDVAVLLTLIDTSSEPDVGKKAFYNILSHAGRLAILDPNKLHHMLNSTQSMLDDILTGSKE